MKQNLQHGSVLIYHNKLTTKEWLQYTYEEALDMAVYLKRTMEEMDALL